MSPKVKFIARWNVGPRKGWAFVENEQVRELANSWGLVTTSAFLFDLMEYYGSLDTSIGLKRASLIKSHLKGFKRAYKELGGVPELGKVLDKVY